MRDKKKVEALVGGSTPFVYTSGRFDSNNEKTTIAVTVAPHPSQKGSVYVYDLRHDPTPFKDMSPADLAKLLTKFRFEEGELRLPVKQLQYNKCPAVAPLAVLQDEDKQRLKIDMQEIEKNLAALAAMGDFSNRLEEAVRITEKQKQTTFMTDIKDVDAQLYDGFFNDSDKTKMRVVRGAGENELADLSLDFTDPRLDTLLFLYKARQFPKSLTADEQKRWDAYRSERLVSGGEESKLAKYIARINELSVRGELTQSQLYALEELSLYGQSIVPYEA